MKVTGLDLSLTGSGVASIHVRQNLAGAPIGIVTSVREHGSKPTMTDLESRSIRLRSVASRVITDCRGSDIVAIEDLYMGNGTGAQLDRAGLWWIVVNSLIATGIPVVAIANNHLKMYATGRGAGKGSDKDYVLAATVKRYPDVDIVSNNTADALNLAAMTARFYGHPIEDSMPATNLRALAAVRWPNLPNHHPLERNA